MELYYAPMACSLAARIACAEHGVTATLRRVDLVTKQIEGGGDLRAINPMGQVPTLVRDDGRVLTENVAVLLHLSGARGDDELLRWLCFVATELHKNVNAQLFTAGNSDAIKAHGRQVSVRPLGVIDAVVATRDVLVGESFTVADAYLLWAIAIMPYGGVSFDAFPALRAYRDRHLARPSVATAFALERAEYGL